MKLALVVLLCASCFAADHVLFQSGTLLDITTTDRLFEGTSYRYAVFVVRVGDLVYTAEGDRLGRLHTSLIAMAASGSGYSGSDLIIGDPIQVAIDKKDLILTKSNGKRFKIKILKQVRVADR